MQVVGIDVWDGSFSQVQNYAHGSGRNITYPLGMQGSGYGNQWRLDRHSFVIIDGNGIIQYITPQSTPYPQRLSQHRAEMLAKLDELTQTTGVQDQSNQAPATFKLHQNSPNPFREKTILKFEMGQNTQQQTRLVILDLLGREVLTLINAPLAPGIYSLAWDGKDKNGRAVPPGIYFYELVAGQRRATKRMVYLP